jgi:transaldolase
MGSMMDGLKTRVFADGADLDTIAVLAEDPRVSGFTTNPTLMRSAGLTDYERFARDLLERVADQRPVSLEVCADAPSDVRRQARVLASWAPNIYVKVPITTTKGKLLTSVVRDLASSGIHVNVTAVFTPTQVERCVAALDGGSPSFVSVFAGRIADAGVDPLPIVAESVKLANDCRGPQVIWASPREVFNLIQADSVGCHVITMTVDLIRKLDGLGRNLEEFSRETVAMFHRDALAAGLAV